MNILEEIREIYGIVSQNEIRVSFSKSRCQRPNRDPSGVAKESDVGQTTAARFQQNNWRKRETQMRPDGYTLMVAIDVVSIDRLGK